METVLSCIFGIDCIKEIIAYDKNGQTTMVSMSKFYRDHFLRSVIHRPFKIHRMIFPIIDKMYIGKDE